MNNKDKRKLTYAPLMVGCLGLSFFCLVYPIYVIRPFRHQGVRELAAALVILRFRPVATALCAVVALLAVICTGAFSLGPRGG